ncbi:MAG: hypothetical protein ACE5OQ_00915 [Woeseia sp.]
MNKIKLLAAKVILICVAPFPGASLADEELDVTMDVIDDLAGVEGVILETRAPDGDDEEREDSADGGNGDDDPADDGEGEGDSGDRSQEDGDDDFEHGDRDEFDDDGDFGEEEDGDEGDDVDLDEPDEVGIDGGSNG